MSERRQIKVFDPQFEEVRGGVKPSLMACWKARVNFLLGVTELFFYRLPLRRYKTKCQKSLLSGGGGSVSAKISGRKGSSLRNIFWFLEN